MNNTCSGCGNPATVEIINGCFLCDHCEAVLKTEIQVARDNLPNPFACMAPAEMSGSIAKDAGADFSSPPAPRDATAGVSASALAQTAPRLAGADEQFESCGGVEGHASAIAESNCCGLSPKDSKAPIKPSTTASASISPFATGMSWKGGAGIKPGPQDQFPDLPDFLKRERAA